MIKVFVSKNPEQHLTQYICYEDDPAAVPSSSRVSPASTKATPAAAAASFQELGLEFFFAFSAALKLSSVLFASDSFPFCPSSKNCLLHSLEDEQ